MKTNAPQTTHSYLSFNIGSEIFAANVKNVINILEMSKITKVPKSPDYLKGVINLRGSVLPVVDTRIKFGLAETSYTINTCILVLEVVTGTETLRLGAIVDSVQEVFELNNNEILPAPAIGTNYKTDVLIGITRRDNNLIMILDVDKVFAVEEILSLNEIS
ncbi:MAG: purine-binding chemotaxis protein CheW [Bacteroidales bacterium]|nr:purine-binding chemotaxis protein CheW [Bacteroidales bacterium]